MNFPKENRGILWLALVPQDQSALPVEPRFPQLAQHLHVTLQYNVAFTKGVLSLLDVGEVFVEVFENCWNDKIQALRVKLPDNLRFVCQNEDPYITVSMREGVRPVMSNVMLGTEHHSEPVSSSLSFKVEFFRF